jgi:hypothetical protein
MQDQLIHLVHLIIKDPCLVLKSRAPVSFRRILSAGVPGRSGAEGPCAPGFLLASAERAGSKMDVARDASDDGCSRQLAQLSLLRQSH